jgi:putative tricarboxylic transport membrane protein
MRVNDALTGAILFVFAIVLFAYARTFPAIPGQEYGAAVFPMTVAVGLASCSVLLMTSGIRNWNGAVAWNDWARTHHAWFKLAAAFGLILVYILAANAIGFVPMSIFILVVFFKLMGVRWWIALAVALAVTLLIQQTFSGLLRVPLPLGLFGS